MEKDEKEYNRLIQIRAKERNWDQLKTLQVKAQAARVVRMRAILKSNYARMVSEPAYRKKVQDPIVTESVFRFEASAQRQEAILNQMLGLDEMHEAKVASASAKAKPTELQVIVGGALSKAKMAAGDDSDGDSE
jgi:hypothetical protein